MSVAENLYNPDVYIEECVNAGKEIAKVIRNG
jgi:hypothetical protein